MKLRSRRVYEEPSPEDGTRVLIDRLWPRGLSKERARIDWWAKGLAPSTELRRWYGHDPAKWEAFRERYFAELDARPEDLAELRERIARGPTTLVFSSREERLNNASALIEYLER